MPPPATRPPIVQSLTTLVGSRVPDIGGPCWEGIRYLDGPHVAPYGLVVDLGDAVEVESLATLSRFHPREGSATNLSAVSSGSAPNQEKVQFAHMPPEPARSHEV